MARIILSTEEYDAKRRLATRVRHAVNAKKPKKPREPRLCDLFRVAASPVKVRLPWPPSVNHYWVRTKYGMALSKRALQYRKLVERAWREQAGAVTFRGRLAMRMVCVFPDRIERDLDNLRKAVWDSLAHAGAYESDTQIRLDIAEQDAIAKPGWIDVTIGPKPGVDQQRGLFEVNF
jgi:crossover junction endodeoxyribonuclease RusA